MKRFYLLLSLVFAVSCSETGGEEVIPDKPSRDDPSRDDPALIEKYRFKLSVREDEKNIFELTEFYLWNNEGGGLEYTFYELGEAYDSLVWNVAGLPGRCRVFTYEKDTSYSGASFMMYWGHCFILPGDYETHLIGYKDNKVVHSDTLRVRVVDRKDFLNWNWEDVIDMDHSMGYEDKLSPEDHSLVTRGIIHAGVPSVRCGLWAAGRFEEPLVWRSKSDSILYAHMNRLYGEPDYDRDSPELAAKYDALFSYKAENAEPRAIWLTDKTKVVLLLSDHPVDSWCYAEPR